MKLLYLKPKPLEATIHIISWLLIFLFPIMLTEWGNKINWHHYLRDSLVPLCSLIVFYSNYLYIIPQYLFQNKVRQFLFFNILIILLLVISLHLTHSFIRPNFEHEFNPSMMPPHPPKEWMFLGRHLIMLLFVAGLSTAIRISLRWQHTEERLIKAEREKTEAELKNLKYQLNPHFLLNTLNNIYALIEFDNNRAQVAVQELSKLLRHVLYENHSAKIPLTKELDFINNYISLMRIRISQSVNLSVKLDAGEKPPFITPLTFISLIENAFKHGISPTEESFISIFILGYPNGKIKCEITNSYFPKSDTDKSGSGIGLAQTLRRLELSYPNNYEWIKGTNPDKTIYTSCLTIQTL